MADLMRLTDRASCDSFSEFSKFKESKNLFEFSALPSGMSDESNYKNSIVVIANSSSSGNVITAGNVRSCRSFSFISQFLRLIRNLRLPLNLFLTFAPHSNLYHIAAIGTIGKLVGK